MFIFSCRQCGGSLLQDRPTRALSAAVTLQQQTTAAHHNQGWLLLLLRRLHNTTRFTVTEQGGNSGCCRRSWFHIVNKWRDEGLRQPANHNKPMTSCWGFFYVKHYDIQTIPSQPWHCLSTVWWPGNFNFFSFFFKGRDAQHWVSSLWDRMELLKSI